MLAVAGNNARIWVAGAALGFCLAGPQVIGVASADTGERDTGPSAATERAKPAPKSGRAARTAPVSRAVDRPARARVAGATAKVERTSIRVAPSVSTAATPVASAGTVAAAADPVTDFVTGAKVWVDTFANLYPWWSGALLPAPVRRFGFNATPTAGPMQVELDLPQGITSLPIAFTASDPDGDRLIYSVPTTGLPGAPQYGTVAVDNTAGTFTYTPSQTFIGTDTFSFVVSDETDVHVHAWDGLINAAFGVLETSLAGGHQATATVTVFNNVDIDIAGDITGEFSVLTYDVSGTPFPFSDGPWPRITNTAQIGSRLNGFDIVNVQDDIAYHPFLIAGTAFPDRTAPSVPTWAWPIGAPFSDGLNSLSSYYI